MVSMPLNKGNLRNSRCQSVGCDSLYLQSELKITHANTPTALSRFRNVIFLHHYVMACRKTVIVLKVSNVTFAELFTSNAKI